MVQKVARFEYIVTDSELEALVLECNLIKEHRPKYNTMLKDDKTYPYIRVTVNGALSPDHDDPRVKKDGAKYFGPFTSGLAVKDTIELLRKIYKIRSCNRTLPNEGEKSGHAFTTIWVSVLDHARTIFLRRSIGKMCPELKFPWRKL